jgi:hypothetical protein
MKLRDHRNKAKQWSFGRAQLSPAGATAHYGKRRTRLTSQRVKAAEAARTPEPESASEPEPEVSQRPALTDDEEA